MLVPHQSGPSFVVILSALVHPKGDFAGEMGLL
jgi:hypothetical protein